MRPATTVGARVDTTFATAGREVVAFALRAPSVENTQPWRWRIGDRCLEVHADRACQLPADAGGRNLTISCGAALEYAVVGAAARGWHSSVELLPDRTDPDLLARVLLRPGPVSHRAAADASLLAARATDRRRLIPWPVPPPLLHDLAARPATGTASTVAVTNPGDRVGVELLVSRAAEAGRAGEEEAEEHALGADGLLVIVSECDDAHGWLDSGRVLCRAWTVAMDHGLAVVPHRGVIEVPETRAALRRAILRRAEHPQLLLRLGWQELARSPIVPTERRRLEDVLLP